MLGADPEIILKKNRRKIPAFGLIGGTKKVPAAMTDMPRGFFYQEDGAAYEFNIPPAYSSEEFQDNIQQAANWTRRFLDLKGLDISSSGHIKLTKDQLTTPQALEIGCVEDYCAYLPKGYRKRLPFTAAALGANRYAGGHIHVQFNHTLVPKHVFVKMADLAIMLAGVVVDKQGSRRNYYGMAGIYRDKEYGVELRGPSNMWCVELMGTSSPYSLSAIARRQYAVGIIRKLFELATWTNLPKYVDMLGDIYTATPWHDVQTAINTEDVNIADQLMTMLRAKYKEAPFYIVNKEGQTY
jgi:hypothetical protein